MAKDSQGNDLSQVNVPVTGCICLVPYSEDNVITSEMIATNKAVPDLPAAYDRKTAALGLITSDGGPQDSIDQDDAVEFWQQGYALNSEPTITTAFTLAEDNEMSRLVVYGTKPDENGVIGVDTLTPDTKWMAYQEEAFKNGRVDRRAGVVQLTSTEPGQSERGSVKGMGLTLTWQSDDLYGGHKYIESVYDPASGTSTVPVSGVTLSPAAVSVKAGADAEVTATVAPGDATDKAVTATIDKTATATCAVNGSKVTVHGVAAGTATLTVRAGGKSATAAVTVTAAS